MTSPTDKGLTPNNHHPRLPSDDELFRALVTNGTGDETRHSLITPSYTPNALEIQNYQEPPTSYSALDYSPHVANELSTEATIDDFPGSFGPQFEASNEVTGALTFEHQHTAYHAALGGSTMGEYQPQRSLAFTPPSNFSQQTQSTTAGLISGHNHGLHPAMNGFQSGGNTPLPIVPSAATSLQHVVPRTTRRARNPNRDTQEFKDETTRVVIQNQNLLRQSRVLDINSTEHEVREMLRRYQSHFDQVDDCSAMMPSRLPRWRLTITQSQSLAFVDEEVPKAVEERNRLKELLESGVLRA